MRYLTKESKPLKIEHYLDDDDTSKWNAEAWKLDVGAECNRLLAHADHCICAEEPFRKDLRSIVARVAEFESLEKEEE